MGDPVKLSKLVWGLVPLTHRQLLLSLHKTCHYIIIRS